MNAYQLLYAKAREKHTAAIDKANEEYHRGLVEIDRLLASMGVSRPPRPRYTAPHSAVADGDSLAGMTTYKAAEHVLRENQPLTMVELTIEVQRRGCRTDDDPRKVAHCIRGSFFYHRGEFRRDGEGRWWVLG